MREGWRQWRFWCSRKEVVPGLGVTDIDRDRCKSGRYLERCLPLAERCGRQRQDRSRVWSRLLIADMGIIRCIGDHCGRRNGSMSVIRYIGDHCGRRNGRSRSRRRRRRRLYYGGSRSSRLGRFSACGYGRWLAAFPKGFGDVCCSPFCIPHFFLVLAGEGGFKEREKRKEVMQVVGGSRIRVSLTKRRKHSRGNARGSPPPRARGPRKHLRRRRT